MDKDRYFSTSEIARLYQVTVVTVGNWIRSGKLKASRLPGGHYRIAADNLTAFLGQTGMHIPSALSRGKYGVLIITDQASPVSQISRVLGELELPCQIETAADCLNAGAKIEVFAPELVIVDLSLAGLNEPSICRRIRQMRAMGQVKILAVKTRGQPAGASEAGKIGADASLAKPLSNDDLRATLSELL